MIRKRHSRSSFLVLRSSDSMTPALFCLMPHAFDHHPSSPARDKSTSEFSAQPCCCAWPLSRLAALDCLTRCSEGVIRMSCRAAGEQGRCTSLRTVGTSSVWTSLSMRARTPSTAPMTMAGPRCTMHAIAARLKLPSSCWQRVRLRGRDQRYSDARLWLLVLDSADTQNHHPKASVPATAMRWELREVFFPTDSAVRQLA